MARKTVPVAGSERSRPHARTIDVPAAAPARVDATGEAAAHHAADPLGSEPAATSTPPKVNLSAAQQAALDRIEADGEIGDGEGVRFDTVRKLAKAGKVDLRMSSWSEAPWTSRGLGRVQHRTSWVARPGTGQVEHHEDRRIRRV